MKKALFGGLVLLLAVIDSARAQAIYDNGAPDRRNGSEMTRWIEADDFSLAAPARLHGVRLWQVELEGAFVGSYVWQIYRDKGAGGPGELLVSGTATNVSHVKTGYVVFGRFEEYVSTFEIPPVSLAQGTYWLALHNGPLSNTDRQDVFWAATASASGASSHAKAAPFGGGWSSNASPGLPADLAFQVNGVTGPQLTTFTLDDRAARIGFTTSAGYKYRVEYKDNLMASWAPLLGANMIAGNGEDFRVTDIRRGRQSSPQRFYRVALVYTGPGEPVLTSYTLSNGAAQLSFTTAAGYLYRVEFNESFSEIGWKSVSGAEAIVGTGGVMEVVDREAEPEKRARRFYRVSLF